MRRRLLLGSLCSGFSVVAAGCNRFQSTQSLSLGLVRVVNLDESPVDVRLVVSSTDDETVEQRAQTLHGLDTNGDAQADELVYRPEPPTVVSNYEYLLYINDESVMSVDGQQVVSSYNDEYDDDSCLVIHFYINEIENDISYSSELYDDCKLPN